MQSGLHWEDFLVIERQIIELIGSVSLEEV